MFQEIDLFPYSEMRARVFKFFILISTLPMVPVGRRMRVAYEISALLRVGAEKGKPEL